MRETGRTALATRFGQTLALGLLVAGFLGASATLSSAQPQPITGQCELVVWAPASTMQRDAQLLFAHRYRAGSVSVPSQGVTGLAVDIVRLSLDAPRPGLVSGTWDETTLPSWDKLGLVLGRAVAHGIYPLKGSVDGVGYHLRLENAHFGPSTFSIPFGHPPRLDRLQGCVPLGFTSKDADQGADLYLADPSGDSYLFFRPHWFAGVALNHKLTCQGWPPAVTPVPSQRPTRVTPNAFEGLSAFEGQRVSDDAHLAMSFFDETADVPAPDRPKPTRRRWRGDSNDTLGLPVPFADFLVRTDDLAIIVTGLVAFPEGCSSTSSRSTGSEGSQQGLGCRPAGCDGNDYVHGASFAEREQALDGMGVRELVALIDRRALGTEELVTRRPVQGDRL